MGFAAAAQPLDPKSGLLHGVSRADLAFGRAADLGGPLLTLYCLRMQKIFSTRLDEATISEIERVTARRRISKRRFLEDAIRLHAQRLKAEDETDVWSETMGAWRRRERPTTTIRTARRAFQEAFERHQKKRRARLRR